MNGGGEGGGGGEWESRKRPFDHSAGGADFFDAKRPNDAGSHGGGSHRGNRNEGDSSCCFKVVFRVDFWLAATCIWNKLLIVLCN